MSLNLLAVGDSPDPEPFLTVALETLDRTLGLPMGTLDETFALLADYPSYHEAYLRVSQGTASRVAGDTLGALP